MKGLVCLMLSICLIFVNFSFAQPQGKSQDNEVTSKIKKIEKSDAPLKPQVRYKVKKNSAKAQEAQDPKRKKKLIVPIIIGLVVVGGIAAYLLLKKNDDEMDISYQGSVSDPVGDSQVTVDGKSHDLVSGKIEIKGEEAIFEVHYASGEFHESLTRAIFSLDTDQNIATGHPGLNSSGTLDADQIGVEYLIFMGPQGTDYGAFVYSYTGTINNFDYVGKYVVAKLDDGFNVSIPLSIFPGEDGRMNFKVISQAQYVPDNSGSTGIIDYMPDRGLPAGVVK